jgi:hypothetical protein
MVVETVTWNCNFGGQCNWENDAHRSPRFCGKCGAPRPRPKPKIGEEDKIRIETLINLKYDCSNNDGWGPFDQWTEDERQQGVNLLATVRGILGVDKLEAAVVEHHKEMNACRASNTALAARAEDLAEVIRIQNS